MREETLYELETPYRQKFKIRGFRFQNHCRKYSRNVGLAV